MKYNNYKDIQAFKAFMSAVAAISLALIIIDYVKFNILVGTLIEGLLFWIGSLVLSAVIFWLYLRRPNRRYN